MTASASVGGDGRLRLFCALTLPEEVLDALAGWQRRSLRSEARLVDRANLHVTLAFLGTHPAGEVGPIAAALRDAVRGQGRPLLEPTRYRETRSVGMLVLGDESGRAETVALRLHERLEQLGVYRREARPWLPHITVLRFRVPPRLRPPLPDVGTFSPSGAAVYHSALRSGGAQYTVLETVSLGG